VTRADCTTPRPGRFKRHRDSKKPGLYYRHRADGSKSWSYYDSRLGRAVGAFSSRKDALDAQAKARLDKSAGLPPPDTRTLISDLAEEVREIKSRRLRASSLAAFEHALDRRILPELGHLKPAQVGADRVARLIRSMEQEGLAAASIKRYLTPLAAIFSLAIRRGIVATSPLSVLSDDERPQSGTKPKRFEWSPEAISKLIAVATELSKRKEARYNYAPLIQVLALTGLRIGEALALCWADVDLLGGTLHVRQTLGRDGTLGEPKTAAGVRDVPLTPGLVDLLVRLKPEDATDEQFVFAGRRDQPLSYWNVRKRGFARRREGGPGGHHRSRPAARGSQPLHRERAVGRGCGSRARPCRREHHAEGLRAPLRPLGCRGPHQGSSGVGHTPRLSPASRRAFSFLAWQVSWQVQLVLSRLRGGSWG
jgi:integrase